MIINQKTALQRLKRIRKKLSLFLVVICFGMATFSCNKDFEFENPFDPGVNIPTPSDLRVVLLTDSSLTLQWNGSYKISGKEQEAASAIVIEQSVDGTNFTIIDSLSVATASGMIKRHFTTNQSYYFYIYARFGTKTTGVSNVVNTVLSFLAPTKLASVKVSETERQLTWQSNSGLTASFRLERKLGVDGTFSIIGHVPGNTTTFTDSSVIKTDTSYYYRVCGVSGAGTLSPYDTATVFLVFNPPKDLYMTCQSSSSVELEWTVNPSFEDGYRLMQSINNQPFIELTRFQRTTSSYTLRNLTASNTYRYRIDAYTRYNNSSYSSLSISSVTSQVQLLYYYDVDLQLYSLAFSPDGKVLACAGNYNVDLRRVGDGGVLAHLIHYGNVPVWSVKYSHDGNQLAFVNGGRVFLWDPHSYKPIATLSLDGINETYSVCFSKWDDTIITNDEKGNIELWNTNTKQYLGSYNGYNNFRKKIDISPDGQYVGTGDPLQILSLQTGTIVQSTKSTRKLKSILFHPAGQIVCCVEANIYRLDLWDIHTGALVKTFQEVYNTGEVAFDPSGDRITSTGREDGIVNIWNVQTGALLMSINNGGLGSCIAFSPLNNLIAIGDFNGRVHVWGFTGVWKTDF